MAKALHFRGNSGGCSDGCLLSNVLTLCLSFHISKLRRVIIPCVIGLGTGLDELIYIKHLKQCLAHRKHYIVVCFFFFCHRVDHSFQSRAYAMHFVWCERQKYSVTFRSQCLSLVLRCLCHSYLKSLCVFSTTFPNILCLHNQIGHCTEIAFIIMC